MSVLPFRQRAGEFWEKKKKKGSSVYHFKNLSLVLTFSGEACAL